MVLVELESDRITVFDDGVEGNGRSVAYDIGWIHVDSGCLGSTKSRFSLDQLARQPVSLLALLADCLEHRVARDYAGSGIALE